MGHSFNSKPLICPSLVAPLGVTSVPTISFIWIGRTISCTSFTSSKLTSVPTNFYNLFRVHDLQHCYNLCRFFDWYIKTIDPLHLIASLNVPHLQSSFPLHLIFLKSCQMMTLYLLVQSKIHVLISYLTD